MENDASTAGWQSPFLAADLDARACFISRWVVAEAGFSLDKIDAKVVYLTAEQGDEIAARILQETCQTLGMAISNVVALLHPERVIIGGGVSLMGSMFWNALQDEFRLRVIPTFASQVKLLPAKLSENVVVIGALCLG